MLQKWKNSMNAQCLWKLCKYKFYFLKRNSWFRCSIGNRVKNIRNDFEIPTHLSSKQGNPESENDIIHMLLLEFSNFGCCCLEKKRVGISKIIVILYLWILIFLFTTRTKPRLFRVPDIHHYIISSIIPGIAPFP